MFFKCYAIRWWFEAFIRRSYYRTIIIRIIIVIVMIVNDMRPLYIPFYEFCCKANTFVVRFMSLYMCNINEVLWFRRLSRCCLEWICGLDELFRKFTGPVQVKPFMDEFNPHSAIQIEYRTEKWIFSQLIFFSGFYDPLYENRTRTQRCKFGINSQIVSIVRISRYKLTSIFFKLMYLITLF